MSNRLKSKMLNIFIDNGQLGRQSVSVRNPILMNNLKEKNLFTPL